MDKILEENQPKEQAGFKKSYSTTDHLQTMNQLIKKSPRNTTCLLHLPFFYYKKDFDSVQTKPVFGPLKRQSIN